VKLTTASRLFGVEGKNVIAVLGQQIQAAKEIEKRMDGMASAATRATDNLDTLQGDMTLLGSTMEAVFQSIGAALVGIGLRDFLKEMNKMVIALVGWIDENKKLVGIVLAGGTALGAFLIVAGILLFIIGELIVAGAALIGVFAGFLSFFGLAAFPIVGALVALVAILSLLAKIVFDSRKEIGAFLKEIGVSDVAIAAWKELKVSVMFVVAAFTDLGKVLKDRIFAFFASDKGNEFLDGIRERMKKLKDFIPGVSARFREAFIDRFDELRKIAIKVMDELPGLVETGFQNIRAKMQPVLDIIEESVLDTVTRLRDIFASLKEIVSEIDFSVTFSGVVETIDSIINVFIKSREVVAKFAASLLKLGLERFVGMIEGFRSVLVPLQASFSVMIDTIKEMFIEIGLLLGVISAG